MRNIIVPVILGSAILVTAYANDVHDNADGHHQTLKGHHAEMNHNQTGNGEQSGHHGTMMKNQHGTMVKDHHGKKSQGRSHGMGHGESLAGKPGKESEVNRTIKVEAGDNMRFSHAPFNIKNGETIKFLVTNNGAISHEFSIGTKDEHVSHGKMMVANPNMHHGPGGASVTIKPGKTEVLIWSFEKAFKVEAACNIPGHYQAGMYSPVMFVK